MNGNDENSVPQDSVAVREIQQRIKNFDNSGVGDSENATIRNPRYSELIIDLSKLVATVYDDLVHRFDDDQLRGFEDKISRLGYRSTGKILTDISAWSAKRREMIEIARISAGKLDDSFITATVGRLLGSSIDLLHNIDSIFEQKITGFLTDLAFNVSPTFGLVSQAFCYSVPYLAHLGLVSSFGDILNSKFILRGVLKVMNEDIQLFESIQEWFQETKELDADVKKLFPFGMDSDIVKDVEQTLSNCDSQTKLFATAFLSNVKMNPSLMKNTKFLSEMFLFSRSEVADEWYKRALKMEHPIDIETAKLEFRNELKELNKSSPDSEATVEVGGHVVKLKSVPHLVQATLDCISIYFSYKELQDGAKHKNSDIRRELSKRAELCLNKIKLVKRKLES